jgi:hypothetical protein
LLLSDNHWPEGRKRLLAVPRLIQRGQAKLVRVVGCLQPVTLRLRTRLLPAGPGREPASEALRCELPGPPERMTKPTMSEQRLNAPGCCV